MRVRIRTISGKLIEDSFPLLKGRKIFYFVLPFRYYALSVWLPPFIRYIVISSRTRNFPDNILKGILAHELCHQEHYIRMKAARYLRFVIGYMLSRRAQSEEERATDRLTIEKGYGRELYELTMISRRDANHKKIMDNYMSPEEIKDYAIKQGKWAG
jgi:hypothetical protein